jgi:hypothetical protein
MGDMRCSGSHGGVRLALVAGAAVLLAGVMPGTSSGSAPSPQLRQPSTLSQPGHASRGQVIGNGTPAHCTSAAVVRAVRRGGDISFDCGPRPVTITMAATAKVENTSHRVVLNGGGLVTLSGGGKHQILNMDTCDQSRTWTTSHCQNQKWPDLVVKNLTFADGNSRVKQTSGNLGGGGAIFDLGGRLTVVNSHFVDNRCYHVGPDLGGAAIRALEQWHGRPVVITRDSFRGGRCSNGSALSSIGVSWVVRDSVMTDNRAIGHGANPAASGSPGGGSGGAIYTDGDHYSVTIENTVIRNNHAREGGGAIFFVSDNNTGTLTISHSTLHHNPSAGFSTRHFPGIFYQSAGHPIRVRHSTIN